MQTRPLWQSIDWKQTPPLATRSFVAQPPRSASAAAATAVAQAKTFLTSSTVRAGSALRKHDEDVAFVHCLAFAARDLFDFSRRGRLDRHLHLHRLEDDARLPFEHVVALFHFDLPNGSGDVRTHVRRHCSPAPRLAPRWSKMKHDRSVSHKPVERV